MVVDTPSKKRHAKPDALQPVELKERGGDPSVVLTFTATAQGETPSKDYTSGMLVWAKRSGQPWFPGEFMRTTDKRVPEDVLPSKPLLSDTCNLFCLVWLFRGGAESREWVWVSPDDICRMGVHAVVDETFYIGLKDECLGEDAVQRVRVAYHEAFRKKKKRQAVLMTNIH
ncbi:hypothetical protein GGI21_003219 [Coemansia aciculifera]|nr:hypothetical protein GGI21_003219 [Coemansia aciculifera]